MSKAIGIVSLTGATCLIFGSAVAQLQSGPAQAPAEKEVREPESGRPSAPMAPAIPRGPGPRVPRHNQDVQAPRDVHDAQASALHGRGGARDVRRAQEALKAKGFDPGAIDGRMGPQTQAALNEFQRSAGMRETGRLDHATLSQLGVGAEETEGTARRESRQPGK